MVVREMTRRGIIKKPDGTELIAFDIPSNLYQVPLRNFINFLVKCRELDDDAATAMSVMTKAVSAFLDIPVDILLEASSGVFNTNSESYTGTIRGLYGYIVKLIDGHKSELMPPDYSFEYRGHFYMVPTIVRQQMDGEFKLPDLSVAEVIEVAEASRTRNQVIKNRGDKDGKLRKKFDDMVLKQIEDNGGNDWGDMFATAGKKVYEQELNNAGDPDGSMALTYYLKTLAVLYRRKDEKLPFEDSQREPWLQDRMVHFLDMTAGDALSADFFLISISQSLKVKPLAVGFLKNLSFAVVAATRLKLPKKGKHGKRPSSIRKKSTKRLVGGK